MSGSLKEASPQSIPLLEVAPVGSFLIGYFLLLDINGPIKRQECTKEKVSLLGPSYLSRKRISTPEADIAPYSPCLDKDSIDLIAYIAGKMSSFLASLVPSFAESAPAPTQALEISESESKEKIFTRTADVEGWVLLSEETSESKTSMTYADIARGRKSQPCAVQPTSLNMHV